MRAAMTRSVRSQAPKHCLVSLANCATQLHCNVCPQIYMLHPWPNGVRQAFLLRFYPIHALAMSHVLRTAPTCTHPGIYIGCMSGTSLDGVDLAAIRIDADWTCTLLSFRCEQYTASERAMLRSAFGCTDASSAQAAEAEAVLHQRHASGIAALLACLELSAAAVQCVVFHGQTVYHSPATGVTVQLGDGQRLADQLGLPVLVHARVRDVQLGGQGAPLAPVFHHAMLQIKQTVGPEAGALPAADVVLNVGGVSNLTMCPAAASERSPEAALGSMLACDCGPGNALLDDAMLGWTGQQYDAGGSVAASGEACAAAVEHFLQHPYFEKPAPKSLDRQELAQAAVDTLERAGLVRADAAGVSLGGAHPVALSTPLNTVMATLTAFTVQSILRGITACAEQASVAVRAVYVAGGGVHNSALMQALRHGMPGVAWAPVNELGWSPDVVESACFALIGARVRQGLPTSWPGTTGVPEPCCGGQILQPRSRVADT